MSLVVKPGCIGAAAPVLFNCIKRSRKLRSGVACVVGGSACGLGTARSGIGVHGPFGSGTAYPGIWTWLSAAKRASGAPMHPAIAIIRPTVTREAISIPAVEIPVVQYSPPSFPNKGRAPSSPDQGPASVRLFLPAATALCCGSATGSARQRALNRLIGQAAICGLPRDVLVRVIRQHGGRDHADHCASEM